MIFLHDDSIGMGVEVIVAPEDSIFAAMSREVVRALAAAERRSVMPKLKFICTPEERHRMDLEAMRDPHVTVEMTDLPPSCTFKSIPIKVVDLSDASREAFSRARDDLATLGTSMIYVDENGEWHATRPGK